MPALTRARSVLRLSMAIAVICSVAVWCAMPAQAGAILFVADPGASSPSLSFFNANSGALLGSTPMPDLGSYPVGVTFGPDGNVYVTDHDSNTVDKFNGTTGAYIGQFVASGLSSPTGLVFGPDGNLYVANVAGGTGYVNRYNGSTGAFIDQFVAPGAGPDGGGLTSIDGLAFGADGNLYVSNSGSIQKFSSTGAYIGPLVDFGYPPNPMSNSKGIVFGPDGNLYVADPGSGYICVFDSTGQYLGKFGSDLGGSPIDLAFGPGGHLYVTHNGGGVAVFSGTFDTVSGTDAQLDDLISYPDLRNPKYLAFSSDVPEPATSCLLLLGVLGCAALRRFRASTR